MAKITFLPSGKVVETSTGAAILNAALDNDIELEHRCGGHCSCTTCRVEIMEGAENVNPMGEEERERLENADASSPTLRLACQVVAHGDVIVRIPD